jgi:threonine/homoserine/homoserine lactone efflux protein
MAEGMGSWFMLVKYLGGLYLIWLGYSLFSKNEVIKRKAENEKNYHSLLAGFMAGFVLTLGDIKAIIFYASLLPAFIDLSAVEPSDIMLLVLITVFSVGGVKAIYAVLSHQVAAYARKTNLEMAARKTAGGLMIGAGGYLIIKA